MITANTISFKSGRSLTLWVPSHFLYRPHIKSAGSDTKIWLNITWTEVWNWEISIKIWNFTKTLNSYFNDLLLVENFSWLRITFPQKSPQNHWIFVQIQNQSTCNPKHDDVNEVTAVDKQLQVVATFKKINWMNWWNFILSNENWEYTSSF